MCMLNERLQILIRPEQRRRLEDEARRRGTSVAALVREAVDARYGPVTQADRLKAVAEIGAMEGRFLSPRELNLLVEKEREEKEFGEYRTRRLVLEAFDKLAESPRFQDEMPKRMSAFQVTAKPAAIGS